MKRFYTTLYLFALLLLPLALWGQPLGFGGEDKSEGPPRAVEKIEAFFSHQKFPSQGLFGVALKVTLAPKMHLYAPGAKKYADFLQEVQLNWKVPPSVEVAKVHFAKGVEKLDPTTKKKLPMYEGSFWVYTLFRGKQNGKASEKVTLEYRLSYQACDDKGCYMPTEQKKALSLPVAQGGESLPLQNEKIFSAEKTVWQALQQGNVTPTAATAGQTAQPQKADSTGVASQKAQPKVKNSFQETIQRYGLFLTFLLVFLWGLGSAFLPCVYPMIPITVSFFTAQSQGSSVRRIVLASVYALGIVVSFTALSLIATAVFGAHLGSLFSYPWFVHTLFLFFFVLALSMFGLFELRLPSSWTDKLQSSPKAGIWGVFLMGALLGVVASPCVSGPYAALLAFVMQGGDLWLSGIAMTLYSIGLAFPFLLLAFFSSMLSAVPRPGGWMVRLRAVMGLVMIGVGIYFENLGGFLSEELSLQLYGVLAILAAPFMGAFDPVEPREEPSVGKLLFKGLGIVLLVGGVLLMVPGLRSTSSPKVIPSAGVATSKTVEVSWREDARAVADPEGYAKEKKKYLLLFFSADWCVYCREMKKTVFRDPEVVSLLEKHFVSVYVDIDKMKGAKELKNKLAIAALPGFAFYSPSGKLVAQTGKQDTAGFLRVLRQVLAEGK